MNSLLEVMAASPDFQAVVRSLEAGRPEHVVHGLAGSQKSYFVASLYRSTRSPLVVVTHSSQQAERLALDLRTLLGPDEAAVFPARDILPHAVEGESIDLVIQEVGVLSRLSRKRRLAVVVPARALVRRLVPAEAFRSLSVELQSGQSVDVDSLLARLVDAGYERVPMVEGRGQFAVRGGIIDVFPPPDTDPIRVDLFGDTVDSIRRFDLSTQRSSGRLGIALFPPARGFVVPGEVRRRGVARLLAAAEEVSRRFPALAEAVRADAEKLGQGAYFEGDARYLPLFYTEAHTVLDYVSGNPVVVIDEPIRVREGLAGVETDLRESFAASIEKGEALPAQADGFVSKEEAWQRLSRFQNVSLSLLAHGEDMAKRGAVWSFASRPAPTYQGRQQQLLTDVRAYKRKGYRVVCIVSTTDRGQRLAEVMREERVDSVFLTRLQGEIGPGSVVIARGELEAGFEFPGLKLLVLTDAELYGKHKHRRHFAPVEEGLKITSYADLNVGDYVVHVNHGIGRYEGVERLQVAGSTRDYVVLRYAGDDKLYVPTDQVGLLQKYIGSEETVPKLYRLGGNEWARVKNRVRESVRDMARGLLRLYAEREAAPGFAFSPDTVWQEEFEDAFPYEETPDQMRSIIQVKRDMEKPRCMDRLLCGDVGYGKTEVAIRAAFKACMDGKQAAILVPTTILAQQHFTTFSERFQGFPIKIAVLSRFQTEAEQKEVTKGLKRGTVDIVIGTHRLLQPDVKFKDLGLVVVDEEQRFGVAHKERLKELCRNVDVLTLTATPIPRTLHMSLVGVRDMSLIETPPEDRFPVRTYVVEYNDSLVREVILREVERGGQVYFVHNRVQTIEAMAAFLQRLVPEVRFCVAHGQMPEDRLEKVMLEFLDRDYDVLVCTTIIESGLDIPNVNTVIVQDADQLGLAQLYQLRGRVGRSNRVAYAYFMYRKERVLTEVAEKRLQAIKEFTDLGSGFKIAMRDLEIRGAGNLLGPEQHGHIAAVGFELYTRLLDEAVRELRGEPKPLPVPEPFIDLGVDAFIPDDYVPDARQKIDVYRKINAVKTLEDAEDLEEELRDRFGDLPAPVSNLLGIARIKVLARGLGATSLAAQKDGVLLRFLPHPRVTGEHLMEVVRRFRGRASIVFGRSPHLRLKTVGLDGPSVLGLVEDVLHQVHVRRAAEAM